MLFLVIATPEPTRPSDVVVQRRKMWPWAQNILDLGHAKSFFGRPGRGMAAIWDVEDNDMLHTYLNQQSEIMPANFQIFPMVDMKFDLIN